MTPRPGRLLAVAGTATEVGKTWMGCALARAAVGRGERVAARKPVQSFEPPAAAQSTDASLLATATGEDPHVVCPAHRWYPLGMAPPMAADALGRAPIALADLLAEMRWPVGTTTGIVETVGGVRSPVAHDGDSLDLLRHLQPDLVILVADAGLGTINSTRLAADLMAPLPFVVFLNRFDASVDLHRRNRDWLQSRAGLPVEVDPLGVLVAAGPAGGQRVVLAGDCDDHPRAQGNQ